MGMQIFALPYAGGTSAFYKPLSEYLDNSLTLTAIDLKGHGPRMSEPLNDNMKDIVRDAAEEIMKRKGNEPFALIGYSFSTTICYELFFYLFSVYGFTPKHIFFMASEPPFSDTSEKKIADLDDEAFLRALGEYGGLQKEFLESEELKNIYVPILKADIRANENNKINRLQYLNCDFSVFYSDYDNKNGQISDWRKCALKKCSFYNMEGNHFFLADNYKKIAQIINDTLI